jgi:hypothetical protein
MRTTIFKFILSLIILNIFSSAICDEKKIIYNEIVSQEQLKKNVEVFNQWFYTRTNSESKNIELRVLDNGELAVFALNDVSTEQTVFNITNDVVIQSDVIYTGKYAELMKELEQKYGYDEMTYLVIILIEEYFNEKSHWRPYLDVLPKIPTTPVYNYWNNSEWLEPELIGTTVLRKMVDYKIALDRRSRNMVGLFEKNAELFDQNIFNEQNVEWALIMIDSKIQYLNYR